MTGSVPSGGTRYVLGVDLGTNECKVCLVTEAGEVMRAARAGYATHAPRPLWAEQDPREGAPAATDEMADARSGTAIMRCSYELDLDTDKVQRDAM